MVNGSLELVYQVGQKNEHIKVNGSYNNEDLMLNMKVTNELLNIELHTKKSIELISAKYIIMRKYLPSDKVFNNGFQSWTDSKELYYKDKLTRISPFAKPVINKYALDKYGDYDFVKYNNKPGMFHGFTYSYIRNRNRFDLIGSLSERNGYTIIYHDMKENQLELDKDIKGIIINGFYQLFNICRLIGTEDQVFDEYFRLQNISKPRVAKMNGWTSWYNYYEDINEGIIMDNLNQISEASKDIGIFQIDDGYETYVGDWLSVDPDKFPNGLQPIVKSIKDKGYKAGLWLAPFVCEKNSATFKNHKSWLLKDKNGVFVHAGHNWSGFYALDIYNLEVRTYIKDVFDKVFNTWGFDMVKLDFLYAISLISYGNRSRGQIMCEGMEFLRECIGDKIILGCGVPLGPSFGVVDYCRIGCDVGLDWDDKAYMRLMHRERISTYNAINNSMYRRQLNGRAFINDPDVFLLRSDNLELSENEKKLLAFVNKVFGGLIFTSDDISEYNDKQMKLFDETMYVHDYKIVSVDEKQKDLIKVELKEDNLQIKVNNEESSTKPVSTKTYLLNLSNKTKSFNEINIEAKSVVEMRKGI